MSSQIFRPMIDKLAHTGVDREVAVSFADTLHHRSCSAKEILFSEGDRHPPIIYLLSGYVKLYCASDEGEMMIQILAGQRDFLGCVEAILYDRPAQYTAECVTDCRLVVIDTYHQDLVKQDKRTFLWMQDLIIRHQLSLSRERAKMLPMKATERYRYFVEQHPQFAKNLPAQTIANYIGVRPQSLSRIKQKLRSTNFLTEI